LNTETELQVFYFLKRRNYRQLTLPLIGGADHAIEIQFRDFPVRVSEDPLPKRVEYYPDFNVYLIDAIWIAIGDYPAFAGRALVAPVLLTIAVANAPAFCCEIRLGRAITQREFTAQMPDAIIDVLDSNNIGR
jgi:hypothetical protein